MIVFIRALLGFPDYGELYRNIALSIRRNQNIHGILSTVHDNYEVQRVITEDKFA